jgi:hypothetical protein
MNFKYVIGQKVFIKDLDDRLYMVPKQIVAQCNLLNKEYYIVDINLPNIINSGVMIGNLYLYPVNSILNNEEAKEFYFAQKNSYRSTEYDHLFESFDKQSYKII